MKKGTMIGEAPGYMGEGKLPLAGWGGDRIAGLARMRGHQELREHFELINLLDYYPGLSGRGASKGAAFPKDEGRDEAQKLIDEGELQPPLFFLGHRVATAFGLKRTEYFKWTEVEGLPVVVLPHPSGVNRWWNSEENQRAGRRFFEEFLK